MTAVIIIAALFLVAAGLGVAGLDIGQARALHRSERRRVDALAANYAAPEISDVASHRRSGALARSILSVGVGPVWESRISTRVLLLAALFGAAVAWTGLCVVLRLPPGVWAPGSVLGALAPPQLALRFEQSRLDAKFADVFPDAIDMIVRMLRAGLPMTAAMSVVAAESVSPVKEAFASVAAQMAIGVSFERALVSVGKRVRSADFRFFTVAASLQHATGGNLVSTLDILSDIIRKRRAGRLKARAVTAEVRTSAYLLAAIPFLVLGGLLLTSPKYLAPLVTDPRGHIIIGMAVGSLLTGFLTMRQMMLGVTRV